MTGEQAEEEIERAMLNDCELPNGKEDSFDDEPLEDGIYFHMPEAQYHAIDRLSSTGIKKLMISSLTFWTETFDPDYQRPETIFMKKGKAYHKRILEGDEAFTDSYVAALSKEDHPDALDKAYELTDYCDKHDLKKSGVKPILIQRILESDPSMKDNILLLLQESFDKEHANQIQISKEEFNEIEKAAAILEASHFAMHFSGGFPEVVLLWTDEVTGVKCKARLDYLRHDLVPDLKTFSNSQRKSIEVCVSQAIAYERYNIQACFYMNGLKAVKKLIKAGEAAFIDAEKYGDFINMLLENEQEFVFVFQETGQVNNCLARKFVSKTHSQNNNYWYATQDKIFDMMHKYRDFMKSHGKELAWLEHQETEYFDDSDFPIWMTDQ